MYTSKNNFEVLPWTFAWVFHGSSFVGPVCGKGFFLTCNESNQ